MVSREVVWVFAAMPAWVHMHCDVMATRESVKELVAYLLGKLVALTRRQVLAHSDVQLCLQLVPQPACSRAPRPPCAGPFAR